MELDVCDISPTPPGLTQLMQEAERLLKKIDARMAQPDRRMGSVRKVGEVLLESVHLMINYQQRVEGISYDIRDLTFVMYGAPGEKADIAGGVARIEEHIDDLLMRRRKIRSWRADRPRREGRDILSAIYDHLLGEVRTWLETTIATIADPLKAAQERGEFAGPNVLKLVIAADFTMPPQFDDLEAWGLRWRRTL